MRQIKPKHAKISYEEDSFTIAPVEDAEIFYNGSFSKMTGGYETMINKGDVFKIGNIELRFVESKEVKQSFEEDKKHIENIEKHKEFDEIEIKPIGQTSINFNKKEELKGIIKADDCSLLKKKSQMILF